MRTSASLFPERVRPLLDLDVDVFAINPSPNEDDERRCFLMPLCRVLCTWRQVQYAKVSIVDGEQSRLTKKFLTAELAHQQ